MPEDIVDQCSSDTQIQRLASSLPNGAGSQLWLAAINAKGVADQMMRAAGTCRLEQFDDTTWLWWMSRSRRIQDIAGNLASPPMHRHDATSERHREPAGRLGRCIRHRTTHCFEKLSLLT